MDIAGNAYVVGSTTSNDFPTSPGAAQTTYAGHGDAFVTKINSTGSALVYSTYLGGSSSDDPRGIAVDSTGHAYITGITESTDFPVTPGAFQTTYGGGTVNAFVTELNPSGSALVYSTYLGGSVFDEGYGIAVDGSGDAYITGITGSTNFPVTPGAFQTTCGGGCLWVDAFVTKLNSAGSALVYSTFLGGGNSDQGYAIAVDSVGNAYWL